jgi:EAL domain-containing protein (putative c-di-GMP-specific phosphodiesterase class I)
MSKIAAYLEGFIEGTGRIVHLPIHQLPCRIGRRVELELQLNDPRVSQFHAEIFREGDHLWIRDLESTNGTYHNGKRISEAVTLSDGDLIRFASLEFRFKAASGAEEQTLSIDQTAVIPLDQTHKQLFGHREFLELLQKEAVTPFFQPIVRLSTGERVGYEVLGRGSMPGLPVSPVELFAMAATYGMEVNLSELFRWVGVRAGAKLDGGHLLFVNMHPAEVAGTQLIHSLSELREQYPNVPVVLEVHESAMTDPVQMRELRANLVSLGIGLAYDDFGAGQARLNELAEVPPDYIKFDVSLIRQIHEALPAKLQLIESLIHIARDLGVETLAEGVELKQERDMCEHLGFDLAQGFMFGKPRPAEVDFSK